MNANKIKLFEAGVIGHIKIEVDDFSDEDDFDSCCEDLEKYAGANQLEIYEDEYSMVIHAGDFCPEEYPAISSDIILEYDIVKVFVGKELICSEIFDDHESIEAFLIDVEKCLKIRPNYTIVYADEQNENQ